MNVSVSCVEGCRRQEQLESEFRIMEKIMENKVSAQLLGAYFVLGILTDIIT